MCQQGLSWNIAITDLKRKTVDLRNRLREQTCSPPQITFPHSNYGKVTYEMPFWHVIHPHEKAACLFV